MIQTIGIPKEVKVHEYRVSTTPSGVEEILKKKKVKVLVQKDAALQIGFTNEDYIQAGAEIVENPKEIFDRSDLIVKVKEPSDEECKWLRKGQVLFTYLHLAAFPEKLQLLLDSGTTAIAYETITDNFGNLPLLSPMSEVAGRVAVQAGATALQNNNQGRGTLLGGVPGVLPGKVVILGGGVVGYNSACMAVGLGADVTIIDISIPKLKSLDEIFLGRVKTLYSTQKNIERVIEDADLVVGGVLIPGAKAPKLVSRKMVSKMPRGSVLVDVAIDQGGCFETSKATTHDNPTYIIDDVVHYCVANIPGSVARTSTLALSHSTLPYVIHLTQHGWKKALENNANFAKGLNVHESKIKHDAVLQ